MVLVIAGISGSKADVAAVVSKWTGVPVEKAGNVVFGKTWREGDGRCP
jgi:hypothetical protein